MTKLLKQPFNSRAYKAARVIFMSGLATVALSACVHNQPQADRNQTVLEWNAEAHQLQNADHERRLRYAKEGKDLQRKYLLQQYRKCKSDEISGKSMTAACGSAIKKVEGPAFRY
ncbi:MAG: hypothetical protein HND56_05295 [Pseudomonadota bacterium]|nr:hypothetical protein [Pseudomonadota bacterium]QKK05138.1 MAG: hypothetical protein HND56_05295 [Pseudomonadota bacterium]